VAAAVLAVLVLAPAVDAGAAERTIGQVIDDAAIVAEVKARLAAEKLSNLVRIDVKSQAGVVTLGGTVDSAERRARAAQIAAGVTGVKTVVNAIEVAGEAPAGRRTVTTEATGTVVAVDPAAGTITFEDGRVLKTTGQTSVWQPSSLGALRPGSQVLVRGATLAAYDPPVSAGARHWRMATVTRVDRTTGELVLSDGTTARVTPGTHLRRAGEGITLDQIEPGAEVVVHTTAPGARDASDVTVVWTPTASAR
jgi:hypothetical protein